MTRLTAPRRFSSLLVLLAALCVTLAAVTSIPALDIVGGLPLALLLPGAALFSAIDPWHRQVEGPERYMWSVGSSIGIVILGGLLLNATGGITRPRWLFLVSMVVLGFTIVSWLRGADRGGSTVASNGNRPSAAGLELIDDIPSGERPRRVMTPLFLRNGALLLAAVIVVSDALFLSQHTNAVATREHFVEAWVIPHPVSNPFSGTAQVGVKNFEGGPTVLVIRVMVGSSSASTWTVALAQGQNWTHTVSRNYGERVSATVAMASHRSVILDHVNLAEPA